MIVPVAAAVRLIGQGQTVNKPSGAIRKQKRPILAFQFLFSTSPYRCAVLPYGATSGFFVRIPLF